MSPDARILAGDLARARQRVAALQGERDRLAGVQADLQARVTGLDWYIAGLCALAARIAGHGGRGLFGVQSRVQPTAGAVSGFTAAAEAAGREWHGDAADAFVGQTERLAHKVGDAAGQVEGWADRQAAECRRAADAAQKMRGQLAFQLGNVNDRLIRIPGQIASADGAARAAQRALDAAAVAGARP